MQLYEHTHNTPRVRFAFVFRPNANEMKLSRRRIQALQQRVVVVIFLQLYYMMYRCAACFKMRTKMWLSSNGVEISMGIGRPSTLRRFPGALRAGP